MAKPRLKTDPAKMSAADFRQFLTRKLEPCEKNVCYEDAIVLVSYPSFDGRLRWCVCERCGVYHVKPELPQPTPSTASSIPSVPGSQLMTLMEFIS